MYYEEADEWVKEVNERVDRIETNIKTQSDTWADLEKEETMLEQWEEIVERVYGISGVFIEKQVKR